jgi:asparagine synthase (glutamine-hydrolysing)
VCGIVGVIDTIEGRVSSGLLASLARMMHSRGPNGGGHFFSTSAPVGMAMRRLSIIDLAGGWQPFYSRGERVVAFQNGEIYNHRFLRSQLQSHGHPFLSESDTEVLAHGYAEWGADGLVERLDGMFALAILDQDRRELHLARDRLGEKPLFYVATPGRFAYSSDLLTLASLPWVSTDISPSSLDYYLALHYVPGDSTIFECIHRVLPGERIVVPIDRPQPRRIRYFRPPLGAERPHSDDELNEIIVEAVHSRMLADVPVGIFLSGGLDSSILAAIAAQKQSSIATFSMGFRSRAHDEAPYAAAVANAIGSDHHHFVFDNEAFGGLLPKVAAALDEPVGDQALLPLYWLCQEARSHVVVALSGEGADELFGGYSYYREQRHTASRGRLLDDHFQVTPSGFPLVANETERACLLDWKRSEVASWEADLLAWVEQSTNSLQRALASDLTTWLPDDLLVKFDRMSMAHSLEGRAPYLSPQVVAAGLALPMRDKVDGTHTKVALRRIAARWLPQQIVARPKQGFVLPMRRWLKQWYRAQGPLRSYFSDHAVPGLQADAAASLVENDLQAGVQRERLLFALALLVEWYAAFAARRQEMAAVHRNYARPVVYREDPMPMSRGRAVTIENTLETSTR